MISETTDLEAARTGLRQWYADLLGLELARVQWEDEPRTAFSDGLVGLLQPVAERQLGRGETLHERDDDAPEGEELVRKRAVAIALSLSLKLDGYDQRINAGPFFALSSVATKLRGGPSLAALRDGDRDDLSDPPRFAFAVIRSAGPFNVARDEAGRRFPRAALDVTLGYTRVESLSPLTFIEAAEVTSHLRDTDGTELPSPPNVTEQRIPAE